LTEDTKFPTDHGQLSIKKIISFPPELEKDDEILKDQLMNVILNSYQVQRMDGKARFIIRQLAKAFLSNPQQLPNNMIEQLFQQSFPDKKSIPELYLGEKRAWIDRMYHSSSDLLIRNNLIRLICDYLSGMTDDFALIEHARLYSTSENLELRHY
jgi:dGTPase